MRDVPEMRPIAIANRETGETELKAAMWDDDLHAWVTSDERAFQGPEPSESEGLIMAEQTPDVSDGLMENWKEKIDNLRRDPEEVQRENTNYVSESHVRDESEE